MRFEATTAPIPAPTGWTAQRYRGVAGDATSYVCPRCSRSVLRRTDHVVAWPTDEKDERHRHWHTACWTSAVKEGVDRYRF